MEIKMEVSVSGALMFAIAKPEASAGCAGRA